MLTREEAAQLLYAISETRIGVTPKVKEAVARFTEKPKREIKVGDIYRDGRGIILEVKYIDGKIIYTTDNDEYYIDGRYSDHPEFEYDLDLSKRYRLVEITDE